MSNNDNQNQDQSLDQSNVSRILIEFAAPGSCQLDMKIQGVTPEQMMFLGRFLGWHADRMMEKVQERRESQQIAVPRPGRVLGSPLEGLKDGLIRGRR